MMLPGHFNSFGAKPKNGILIKPASGRPGGLPELAPVSGLLSEMTWPTRKVKIPYCVNPADYNVLP